MVIERERKSDSDDKQNRQYDSLIKICQRDARQVNRDDEELGRDHVRHDRAHKKSFFAFENHAAGIALMLEIERARDDRSSRADGTLQLKRAPNREANFGPVFPHWDS